VIVKGTVTPSTSSAIVKLNHDGSVHVLASAVEMGQDIQGTLALIAAAELQVPVERVVVSYPDTDLTPHDQQTSSSRSTFATGGAVRQAARMVRQRLLEEAADQLEIAPTDLALVDGRVVVAGSADASRTTQEVLARSGRGNLLGDGAYLSKGGLDPETGRGIASVHWHQAAGAADVSVDLETGRVELVGFRSAVFAGAVINPVGAELQAEGNLAFGLGQALWEELVFDGGQLQNTNLGEYMISGTLDVPEGFSVSFLEHPDRAVIHGLGETSLPTIMPAIANAVFRATGVRVRDLPITPEKVLRGLAELAASRGAVAPSGAAAGS
jgi:CO/xanthine dehydrogenase Mo-binding subunit